MKKHVQVYLEEELGFRLCIHERDFVVGETIPANIQAAINHSRRMIMIISRYATTSVQQKLQDKRVRRGKGRRLLLRTSPKT